MVLEESSWRARTCLGRCCQRRTISVLTCDQPVLESCSRVTTGQRQLDETPHPLGQRPQSPCRNDVGNALDAVDRCGRQRRRCSCRATRSICHRWEILPINDLRGDRQASQPLNGSGLMRDLFFNESQSESAIPRVRGESVSGWDLLRIRK